jgi:mxaJ protein
MFSRFLSATLLTSVLHAAPATLRVCADPNNLPFSNQKLEGFENRIAEIVGRDLHANVEYFWWAQRRGFARNTLGARECDLIIGVPAGFEMAQTTKPYYRSTYVFVTLKASGVRVRTFDDPVLREWKIGVQLIGDDYTNTPPAHALARRGIVRNVAGYHVAGDYSIDGPSSAIVQAVIDKEVDVAVVWGPLAGYYAQRSSVPLELTPVSPRMDTPSLPFEFAIAMGVRRGDVAMKNKIERALMRRRVEIEQVLRQYGVPVVPGGE